MKKLNRKEIESLKKEYKICLNDILNGMLMNTNGYSDEDKVKQKEWIAKDQERLKYINDILEDNQTKVVFSPDTLLIVGANLLGILLILNYEKLDIVSSKAVGFILKARVWKDSFLFLFRSKNKAYNES